MRGATIGGLVAAGVGVAALAVAVTVVGVPGAGAPTPERRADGAAPHHEDVVVNAAQTRLARLARRWVKEPPDALDVRTRNATRIRGAAEPRGSDRIRVVNPRRGEQLSHRVRRREKGGKLRVTDLHGYRRGYLYGLPQDDKLPSRLARLSRARAGDAEAEVVRAPDAFGEDHAPPFTDGDAYWLHHSAVRDAPGAIVRGWFRHRDGRRFADVASRTEADGATVFEGSTSWDTTVPGETCTETFTAVERDGVLRRLETRTEDCLEAAYHDIVEVLAIGDAVRVPRLETRRWIDHEKHDTAMNRIAREQVVEPLLLEAQERLNVRAERTGLPVDAEQVHRIVRELSPPKWSAYGEEGVHLSFSSALWGNIDAQRGRAVACMTSVPRMHSPLPRCP